METDYLIIGAGATGMAFADTLLAESDAHITLVDHRAKPGGHWNDAYPFVTLHQPSAFYGVNSLELGSGRLDTSGPNSGFYEMASGAEINAYFDQVMQHRFLPSGRVRYMPMCNHLGNGRVESLLSGEVTQVQVRKKTVEAALLSPDIPATHTRRFQVAVGVRVIAPNELPRLWITPNEVARPRNFCILGAGKTAMDAAVWLLRHGARPESIEWVVPRDSWLQNRLQTQPGLNFFEHSIGGEAEKMAAFAQAKNIDDLFLRLEAAGQMLRIDPTQTPTMYHYATISTGEVDLLRTIARVIRKGRVREIGLDFMSLEQGQVAMEKDTLYIDCTASAVTPRSNQAVFQDGRICIQLLRAPLVVLSAALTAYVEVHGGDEARKNAMCTPVPFPTNLSGYAKATQVSMMNQFQWAQDKALRQWIRNSRLDGFGKMVAQLDKADSARQAVMERLRTNSMAAMMNLSRLCT